MAIEEERYRIVRSDTRPGFWDVIYPGKGVRVTGYRTTVEAKRAALRELRRAAKGAPQ